jgi:hypothetical protein
LASFIFANCCSAKKREKNPTQKFIHGDKNCRVLRPGLPDVIFIPKILTWVVLGWPSRGKCIVYAHLEYFTVIWCIVWPFGIFCGNLVYFTVIWYILL